MMSQFYELEYVLVRVFLNIQYNIPNILQEYWNIC